MCQQQFDIFKTKNILVIIVLKSLRNMPVSVFESLGQHLLEDDPLNGHTLQLSKLISQKYLNLRLHHESKKINECNKNRIRSILTKTILFKNQ